MFQKCLVFLTIYLVTEMSLSLQLPNEREDVMGKYWFMNRYQCERLCWYRKLCKTYSYIYNRTLASDGNCVLHAVNISTNTTSGVSTAWIEREAFWNTELQDNGCRSRLCNETQVCVPTYGPPFYTCLLFSAECQAPSRDDGVYSDVTLLQGQRTQFTCNSSLLWVPRDADNTVTCQVNGKYSKLKGTCKIAIYHSPSVPFNAPLPEVVREGWKACIKGIFLPIETQRMTFNFHDVPTASCDDNSANGGNIYLSLDFRYSFTAQHPEMWWFIARNNCSNWQKPASALGPLLLNPKEYFEITLSILFNNTLHIIFKNITTMELNLGSNNINMTGATYLEIKRHVQLSYVDLGKGCE